MILTTSRLILRPFAAGDLADLSGYATRPEFWRHLPLPEQTPETVAEFLSVRVAQGHPDIDRNWHFAAELTAPGDPLHSHVVGGFRIGIRDEAHRQGDLGWSLSSDVWGRGFAQEGAGALIAFGFGQLQLAKIWATANAENERSWRVMERIGMQREGYLRQHRLVRGEWRDNVLYAILAQEWQAQQQSGAVAA